MIEGEEEIGSENLGKFLDKYKSKLAADFIVLSDTANFDTGVPALTYQLRGICQVDVEVKCLDHPLHSGMWGGPVPDPVQILCRLIADLRSKDGSLDIPSLYKDVARGKSRAAAPASGSCPSTRPSSRRRAGLVKGLELWGEKGYSVYEQLWTRPSLTVIAMESHPIQGSSNQIVDSARARLSLRTVPEHGRGEGRQAARQEAHRRTRPTGPRSRRRSTAARPGGPRTRRGPPSRPPAAP